MSRKFVHIGVGICLLTLSPPLFVCAPAGVLTVLGMIFMDNMKIKARFQRHSMDGGILQYTLMVCAVSFLNMPFIILAPAFFADPMAMIIGSNVVSPKLRTLPVIGKKFADVFENKSVVGTLTAFTVSAAVLSPSMAVVPRLVISSAVAVVEALGGKYDNLMIGTVCIVAHQIVEF